MQRYLSVVAMMLVLGSLAGCAPPPRNAANLPATGQSLSQGDGKPIITVKPAVKPPFQTITFNGEELMVARGEIGRFGGTFFDNQIGDGPKTFNPWASYDATSTAMGNMLFAGLLTTDAYTGEPAPYLAKAFTVSPDKLTYTVTLRKGLKWSDGQPITAQDVVFTWNEIIKPGFGNASNRDVLMVDGQFPQVKALDDLTVEFKTAKPFAPFTRMLGQNVGPAHILRPVVAKGDKAFSAFWGVSDAIKHPERIVSSGMWLLDSYDPRLKVTFKRNPHFFMVDQKGQRLPYLNRYVISFVGDMNNQELQFEQGKADSYAVSGNFVSNMRRLNKPAFKLYNLGPTSSSTFLTLNMNTRKDAQGKPLVDPVKAAWFNDVNFRQAINHAINRQDMVANILKGVGAPLFTPEALSSIYLNTDIAAGFPADIGKAKALLQKSGFTWDQSGQLRDKGGHPVEFNLLTNSGNGDREATGVNIKQDLAGLGMKVNFKPIDFNVLVGKLHEGAWEAVVMGLTGSKLEPHEGVNVWKSDGALHMFNQRKVEANAKVDLRDQLPWEQRLDAIFEQGAQTFDPAMRHSIYNQYQQIVYDQAPFIYLYSPLSIVAVRERIRNFDPTPLDTFHNLEEIWIDPAARQ